MPLEIVFESRRQPGLETRTMTRHRPILNQVQDDSYSDWHGSEGHYVMTSDTAIRLY